MYALDSCGVYNAIEQIATVTGRDKEEMLKGYLDHPLFKQVVLNTYDPFITYGVKQVQPVTGEGTGVFDDRTEHLLNDLAYRRLTGGAAQSAIRQEMTRLTAPSRTLLERILLRDLRAGFTASMVNKVSPGAIYVFKCMLSHKFEPKRVEEGETVAVEPKYDGARALAIYRHGRVRLYSRTGKEFTNFDHIADILTGLVAGHPRIPSHGSYVFDGELISGEFRETIGAIHRKDEQSANTRFYAFDFVPFELFSTGREHEGFTYRKRRQLLESIVGTDSAGLVRVPPVTYCETVEEIMAVYDAVRKEGGEGVIVKALEGQYQPKRSFNWLKIKDQQTLDLPIVDMVEGTGKYEGSLGALVVDHNGVRVNVGSGLTDADRAQFWTGRSLGEVIGQIAEVEFHEETPDGSLRHPRFVRLREDKTLADGPGC